MNVSKVKKELQQRYPGVNIKENVNDNGEVVEIVGEIDKELLGSERDVAVAIIDRSPEHYHNRTTEEYEIIKGVLRVFLDGKPTDMKPGDRLTIEPGTRHRAEGNETWLLCYSTPDWTIEDYHPVK